MCDFPLNAFFDIPTGTHYLGIFIVWWTIFLHIFVIVIIFQLVVLPWVTAFMRVTVKIIDCVHISFRLAEFATVVREGPNHCLGWSFLSRK